MTNLVPAISIPIKGSLNCPKLQFVGECNVLANYCTGLHAGDICHFLSNTLRGRDLEKHFHVYEDANGRILGTVLLYPARYGAYNVLIHPHYRGGQLETALIVWSEQQTRSLLQAANSDTTWINSDVMEYDTIRSDILQAQGYIPSDETAFCYTTRSLQEPINRISPTAARFAA